MTSNVDELPLIIEAAVTPYRPGQPLATVEETIAYAIQSVKEGASVIHHHHDFRLGVEQATTEMIAIGEGIAREYPGVVTYPDFIAGKDIESRTAHFAPMVEAHVIGLLPVDPIGTTWLDVGPDGVPSSLAVHGMNTQDSAYVLELANVLNMPVTVGVYEPGNLRWALACADSGKLPKGSIIKLFFGSNRSTRDKAPAVNFGLPPTPSSLDAYLDMMEGRDLPWVVLAYGVPLCETPLARYAMEKGGHVRVGIEDAGEGPELTNAMTVKQAVALAREVGRPIANFAEARAILGRELAVA